MKSGWKEFEERRERYEGGSRRLFVLGAVVAGAFLAGTQFLGTPKERAAPAAALEASIIQQPTARAAPATDPTRSNYRAPSTAPGRQTYVGIYECEVNGQRVVSDRPCGADAQGRTLVVDQPDPVEAARQRQQTWAAQQRAGSSATSAPRSGGVPATRATSPSNQAACESIERRIAYIDAQMREGYRSQAGEAYREQLRALKEQRYKNACLQGR